MADNIKLGGVPGDLLRATDDAGVKTPHVIAEQAAGAVLTVGGVTVFLKAAPAMDDDPDYSAGDVFGAVIALADAFPAAGGSGVLQSIVLTSVDPIAADAVDVLIFDADPDNSTFTDNDALALDDADLPKLLGAVTLDTLVSVDANSCLLQATALGLPVKADGTADLYAVLVARATIALSAPDGVTVGFGILRD